MQKEKPVQATQGVPARKGALRLLMAVLGRGTPLELAIESSLDGITMANDRALARHLASTVLRWLPDLDALIDSATPKPLPEDARARMVLRIALAGWLKLGTPQHAAVATALPLVEGGPRRLVHGVLGNLMRRDAALPEVPHLPDLFAIRWAMDWGADVAEAAARSLAEEPATDLTLRDAGETAHWAAALGGVSLMPGHVRVRRHKDLGGALTEWPGFAEGAWWVQDLAASLPVRLLGAKAGDSVLDLCAAPGGKTLQLAALGAAVTALDVSDARLERVRENLARTGLPATLAAGDALRWEPGQLFDHILLDAPCSATGIFRRHPDVLHLKGARDLTPLTLLQAALLRRAAAWLKPGGTLVYATCSLDPREGERIAERVVATLPRTPFEAAELPLGLQPTTDGWVRTLPGTLEAEGGMDGFFIGRMRKI
ncbi:RsmB/NOP family class I SAM-dependent RNA methyltransferase [Polymorphobacter fuscus]|uniref:Methyltransferase domain-containing protein n=1 Tax=Sandarakinorhabdus fusca TaxID=1439888 RepID=A0A7C9GNU8_9SPHN|nr:RsmB/NOP family class I SAM-dependent RNA methyltransferase [Polymorphobacter fuscus]KAB7647722.1 RsmB/NOP family class I SAM-dependent RNA methyltransferase [Polymorphobacter fuscus]MQT17017.1 methyltransferase domain-containing protein [Polymorphobacter fuscus]NJC08991.1 16S rRNA (cytosine967-C5)-methyltransferase [Polymorphobacter fuscus]